MSWGTSYKHTGYLSRITKNEISEKRRECRDMNEMLWREILAYMAMTPSPMAKDCEGNEYPFAEFLATRVEELRDMIAANERLIARIDDCIEAMEENPENVTDE